MKRQFYVGVTTEYRPEDHDMPWKACPAIYDFGNRELISDMRSWWRGEPAPYSPVVFRENLATLPKVEKVFDEILLKREDWEPLAHLKGHPEYLNHVCIVRYGENGEEKVERLWVAKEVDRYVLDEN